jgi:chitinase
MIWAIDLDTGTLDALRAVTGNTVIPGSNSPFTLTDLENLFPPELLPPEGAKTSWGLINFGRNANSGIVDPNETGFGFVLITGESHAMTSLKRRKDNPEPLIFLSCPDNVSEQDIHQPHTARVVCMSQDVEACFQIMERGVEDTVVEMPDNVSPTFTCRGRNGSPCSS